MKVKIKGLRPDTVVPYKTYDNDFCYDVVAVSEEEIAPNVWKYGLGFAAQIERPSYLPAGVNLSIDFRPRSSAWKTGMVLSNCTGSIDEGYRGEISAIFYHVMPDMPRYTIGDRVGQIKIGITFPMQFQIVDRLDDTERGRGGYGSTGR